MAKDPYAYLEGGSAPKPVNRTSKSTPKKKPKKKSFWGNAASDLRDIVAALVNVPQLAKTLKNEIAEATGFDAPVFDPSKPLGQRTAPSGAITKAWDKAGQAKGAKAKVHAISQMPGVRLVPGSFVASDLTRPEGVGEGLKEHPLLAALDVLPLVGKATKVGTKGSQLAASAASRAESVGKTAKAARITEKGLGPRELVGELARKGEEAAVKKVPALTGRTPSAFLERSGIGGEKLRSFMKTLGPVEREFADQSAKWIKEATRGTKQFGITPARGRQILADATGNVPNFRASLAPNEREFLNWYGDHANKLTNRLRDEGYLFDYAGETFEKGAARGNLYKAVRRSRFANESAEKALARPEGKFRGYTSDQWKTRALEQESEASRLAAKTPSARWKPIIRDQALTKIADLVEGKLPPAQAAPVVEKILGGYWREALDYIPKSQIDRITKDIIQTIPELKARGVDPVWVHHVPESTANKLRNPQLIRERIAVPSAAKNMSILDMQPWVHDFGVSLAGLGVDELQTIYARRLYDQLRSRKFGKTYDEVAREATKLVEESGKLGNFQTQVDRVINRLYDVVDPTSIIPAGRAGVNPARSSALYLPKGMANALKKTARLNDPTKLMKAAGLPMRAFRASILTFSPMYYCVPDTAEALTRDGWKTCDEISAGDELLTYNVDTASSEWQPATAVNVFPFDGKLQTVGSFLATDNHRWPVLDQAGRSRWRCGTELCMTDRLIRCAPTTQFPESSVLTPRDAAILGWIVTDGTMPRLGFNAISRNGWRAMIYQKKPDYLAEILHFLGSEGAFYGLKTAAQVGHVRVKGTCLRRLHAAGFHTKQDLPRIVTRLNREAAEAMWDAMMKAEGCVTSTRVKGRVYLGNRISFSQQPGPVLDAFQILSHMLGMPVDRAARGITHTVGDVHVKTKRSRLPLVGVTSYAQYEGRVWCPTTPNGTWVMRQNGRIVVTGNTDNLISGAVMLSAHNPLALKKLPAAIKMIKEGKVPYELSRGAQQMTGERALRFSVGREIGELVAGQPSLLRTFAGSPFRFLRWLGDTIDDMYKVTGYLSGEAKALKKGMSAEVAKNAGLELAHKILVDFDRMTPFERSVVRSVIPFYSWTQHILRYTFGYPFDHPVRAAIVSNIARLQEDDWPEGLPLRFKNWMTWKQGEKTVGMSGSGPIPIGSVPDLLTLNGFLSRISPLWQAGAEFLGSDPMSMAPSAYAPQDVEVNPVSGQAVGVRPGLRDIALSTLSPQVAHFVNKIAPSQEYTDFVMNADPEAVRARAWRDFGIRIPRTFDVKKELEKVAKAQEYVAQRQARAAKKRGQPANEEFEYFEGPEPSPRTKTGQDPFAYVTGG